MVIKIAKAKEELLFAALQHDNVLRFNPEKERHTLTVGIEKNPSLTGTGTTLWESLAQTQAHASTILIRLLVGLVFLPEGIQKLIFPEILGAGRFAKIGIPFPELMGPFVGVVETVCGALILLGLLTRLATLPLIVIMIVAIVSTKIPILLGHEFWIFSLPNFARYGFWSMAHEIRNDMSMLLGCLYLLIVGAGTWSLDARWLGRSAD